MSYPVGFDEGQRTERRTRRSGVAAGLIALVSFVGFLAVTAHLHSLPSDQGDKDYTGQFEHVAVMAGLVVLLGGASILAVVRGLIDRKVTIVLVGVAGLLASLVCALVTLTAFIGGGWDG